MARLVAELLERLDLDDVTLVGNDTGGALVQLLAGRRRGRGSDGSCSSRCDAFDNFPPGLTGRTLVLTRQAPAVAVRPVHAADAAAAAAAAPDRVRLADQARRRGHRALDEAGPDRQAEIRRDTVRVLRAIAGRPPPAARRRRSASRRSTGPALVVWASEDRVMPPEHGHRLAELLPQGRLVEIPDSYTLIPLDQPAALAAAIGDFARARLAA